jgi:hypothetical protein
VTLAGGCAPEASTLPPVTVTVTVIEVVFKFFMIFEIPLNSLLVIFLPEGVVLGRAPENYLVPGHALF